MSGLALRDARPADADAIARLEAACFPQPWSVDLVRSELAHERALALVAEAREGGVAGYALLRRLVDEVELLRLAVRPDARRRGLAAALVDAALRAAVAHRCSAALLEVRADNAGAVAFYERTGWRREGRRKRYYADGTDALLYRRPLTG